MQVCPVCGTENPDGFRLCGMCGSPLATDPGPAREERKVVTVLFTDLVGSTAMAERLDPEDVRAVLAPYYARLRAELERYGGTVEKFIGDAVMAVFGAPVAHEDDPERAVRAALAIREALADELQVRTAVNTGEALVALDARPSEGEGMVSGDVVNTAARLQSAAPVNGILVGEATWRATRNAIEYSEAPPVEAKGKSEPIPVWEAVAARAGFGSDVEQQLRTPLVGRDRERSLLADTLARARSEQSVQLVTLVGVPGIGKSRLVAELFQTVEADPELIAWRQGRSLPYGERVSFWALGEIVKSHAGILDTDDVHEAEAKLAAMLADLVDDEREREWLARHTRPLVGLESGDRADRGEAFAAWRRLLEAAAEQRPLVTVFEDLQWADDGLLDFVDHLADWATTVPLLIVGTARPELLDRRPGWGGGKRNALMLSIAALSDEETARLLQRLLDRAVLDADAQQTVLRRAEGNPLYAEEYARMLAERRGDDLPLPETVQGLIAARIDTLAAPEKALLQDASVIGKVFWPSAVGSPDERVLHALERKEFIRRDRRSTIAGETQYAFRHALVRDVAYGEIPRPQRLERHRRAAEWIASLAGDRGDDHAEMLAHHYREALALADATGADAASLREPARRAFVDAAQRALSLNASGTAFDLANDALALTGEGSPDRPAIQLLAGQAGLLVGGEHLPELIGEARDGFLDAGDTARAAEACSLLARFLWSAGEVSSARMASAQAVELAHVAGSSAASASAIAFEARLHELADDDHERARELAAEALAFADAAGDDVLASNALNTIGLARVNGGDAGGVEDLEHSLERAQDARAVFEMVLALNNLANVLWQIGLLDEGTGRIQEARAVCEQYGATAGLLWNDGELVLDCWLHGDFDGVLAAAERFLSHPGIEQQYQVRTVWTARAQVELARGSVQDAVADAERALAGLRESGRDAQVEGLVLVTASRCMGAAGRTGEADALLAEALARPESGDGFAYELPLYLVELGRGEEFLRLTEDRPGYAWREAGRAAGSGALAEAAEIYGRIGAAYPEAWAALLAAEHGDRSRLDGAVGYFERQRSTAYLDRARALLPASA
jgi:class 3 adenylate cyclase/tetratricopeptide (TPR) repeat protein